MENLLEEKNLNISSKNSDPEEPINENSPLIKQISYEEPLHENFNSDIQRYSQSQKNLFSPKEYLEKNYPEIKRVQLVSPSDITFEYHESFNNSTKIKDHFEKNFKKDYHVKKI